MTVCGRPAKTTGQPCKMSRMKAWGMFTHQTYEGLTCNSHAAPAERAEFVAAKSAIEAAENRFILEHHQSAPVRCHGWPVTDEFRRRAKEARDCADPDRAYDLAWEVLADWQDDRCAVCGSYSEVLDHDHATGLARGWLCVCCNAKEGHADIPGGRFERYRVKNPASILGISIRYYSPFTGWAEPQPKVDLANGPRSGTVLSERRREAKRETEETA